jgi:hypothetical protein
MVVESCSQDKQDLAAITGALAAIGALDQVRAVIETPRSHELLWAADIVAYWPRRLCLRCTRGNAAIGRLPRVGLVCLRHKRWLGSPSGQPARLSSGAGTRSGPNRTTRPPPPPPPDREQPAAHQDQIRFTYKSVAHPRRGPGWSTAAHLGQRL